MICMIILMMMKAKVVETQYSFGLTEGFPRFWVSPIQSYNCGACAEINMCQGRGKRSFQHVVDSSSTEPNVIWLKMKNIESFEANLKLYNKNAAEEQAAYKQSFQACPLFYMQNVFADQACTRFNESFLTTLHRGENAEVIIECYFHIDDFIRHCGRAM